MVLTGMNRQIILLLLKFSLLAGSSLVFGGEPAAINSVETAVPDPLGNSDGQDEGFWELARSVAIFLFVISLIFFCSWLVKRWQPGLVQARNGLQVKAVLPLGGRDRIVVVQAGERQLLLGVSPGSIVLLGDYDQLLSENKPDSKSVKQFQDILKS